MSIKRALVSVSDKTGIVDFCRELSQLGVEIISTGEQKPAVEGRSAGDRHFRCDRFSGNFGRTR